MKKRMYLLAPPAAVAVLGLAVYACAGIWPFGNKTIAWCDMNQQVIPLLLELRDVLTGHGSLLYSMQNAGGMNFWGVFLFFISSPFSALVLLAPKAAMWHFINLLVLLKMMFCALTAALFFQRRFPALNLASRCGLAVSYAFCGYAMLFFQNIVWLDMMALFPLLCLAALRLLEDGRPGWFVATLACCVGLNFYLSYMVVVFAVLGSFMWLHFCVPVPQRGERVWLLGCSAVCAALLTGPAWLPSLMQFTTSARGESLLASLGSGRFLTHYYTTIPLLLCTCAVLAVLPLAAYFWKRRTTRAVYILYALMLVPLVIEPINKMWHTGSYQAFPARYGYITVFLGLCLAASILRDADAQPLQEQPDNRFVLVLGAGILLACAVGGWLIANYGITLGTYSHSLWGNRSSMRLLLAFALPATALWLALFAMRREGHLPRRAAALLLCLLVAVESTFSAYVYMVTPAVVPTRQQAAMDLQGRIKDDTFYRVKLASKCMDVNLVGAMGYPTFSHYTSFTSQELMYTMKKLGYSSYWMEISSNGGTGLSDALLGNRYSIKGAAWLHPTEDVIYKNDEYGIVRSWLPTTAAVVVPTARSDQYRQLPGMNRLENQRLLAKACLGTDSGLFTQYGEDASSDVKPVYDGSTYSISVDQQKNPFAPGITYTAEVKGRQNLYFDCFGNLSNHLSESYFGAVDVYANGKLVDQNYPSKNNNGLLLLGAFRDQTVKVEVILHKSIEVTSFGLMGMDIDRAKELLGQAAGVDIRYSGSRLSLDAQAADDSSSLLIALPNAKGLTVKVNGQACAPVPALEEFMAVPLQKGENRVQISFCPPGLKPGLALGCAGVLLTAVFLRRRRRGLPVSLPAALQKAMYWLFSAFAAVVFAAVYLMPVAVWLTR